MRIGVLGAMQIDGGVALRPRSRTVLAALVVGRDRPISAEELADAVWGEDPPRSWLKQVQYCIWDLRKTLGRDVIETVDGAYRLTTETDDLDVAEFEALVERGRAFAATGDPDRAASTFSRALGLWRGHPFEDLDRWMPGRHELARLEELRRSVEEDVIEARMAAGDHRDVVALAERRAAEEPLRERRRALLALAQYRSGNQAAALRTLRLARHTLLEELGIDPGGELVALESAILAQDPTLDRPSAAATAERCPYRGLSAFDAEDRDVFFGRDRDIAACLTRIESVRLLVVSGPSGCGKSSLVRAGLIPVLRRRDLDVAVLVPGGDGDVALSHAVASTGGQPVVVVDQMEELFAGYQTAASIRAFCARLVTYSTERALVIVTIRSDHLGRLGAEPALARLVEQGLHLVGPVTGDDLRATIEGPAAAAGLRLEHGLVDLLVREIEGEPAALPLLSHALAETWERRDGRVLTVEGYRATGEIRGAVARSAEQLYASLPPDQQARLRSLMLRLIVPSTDGEPVRAHLDRQRLPADTERDHVLDLLVRARLVTADETSVELAHEAVARAWPRLREWLDEDAAGQQLTHHLGAVAEDWDSLGRPESELYRGIRLETALQWRDTTAPDLTATENSFLDASEVAADRERRALVEQARRQARQNRRLRWSLTGVASLLVVAMISGVLFVRQRDRAEQTAREARARALASESIGAIDEDPELAILLGLEAVDTTRRAGDDPLPEAITALQQATQTSRLIYRREEAKFLLDVSDDGSRIATDSISDKGTVLIWDAVSGELLRTLPRPDADASAQDMLFSPDGRLVAVDYMYFDHPEIPPVVIVWDSETGDEVARPAHASFFEAFSPDGGRLVTSSSGDEGVRITIWDVATGSEVLSFEIDGPASSARFMADGTSLLVVEPASERVGIYSIADGSLLDEVPTPGFAPALAALNEVTGLLALGSQESRGVQIVDVATGTVVERVAMADVGGLDWSANGELLAVGGGNASPIRILDVSGEDAIVLRGHSSGSLDVAFIGDEQLASTGYAGELRVWDVTPDGPPALRALASTAGTPRNVEFSPDGSEIVMFTLDRTVARIAADTGVVLAERTGQLVHRLPFGAPVSPDWRYVASVDAVDGSGAVLDLQTLAPVSPLPPCTSPVAFSPDAARLVLDGYNVCDQGMGELETPAGADLRSRVVDIASGSELIDLGHPTIFSAEFNPEGRFPAGRYLVVNSDAVTADVYDVVERRLVVSIPVDDLVFHVAFDPTGRWVVLSTGGGRILGFDLAALVAGTPADEAVVLDIDAHDGGIAAFAISANGTLATAALDGEIIRIWDLFTGDPLLELRTGPSIGVSVLRFTPDDNELLYSDGAVLRRFPLNTDVLITQARGILTRGLTGDECHQYLIADCP